MGCHMLWEGNKQGDYRDYMIKKLGQYKYKKLEKRGRSTVKCGKYEKGLIYEYMKEYGLEGLDEYLQQILK